MNGLLDEKISPHVLHDPSPAFSVPVGVRSRHNISGRCFGAANPAGSVVSYFRTLVLASQTAQLASSLRAPVRGFVSGRFVVARNQRVLFLGHDRRLGYRRACATRGRFRRGMDVERYLVRAFSKGSPLAFFRGPSAGIGVSPGCLLGSANRT